MGAISFYRNFGAISNYAQPKYNFSNTHCYRSIFLEFLYKTWDGSERVLSLFLQKGEKGQRHIITFSRRFCGESPSAAPKREGKRKATGRERGSRSPSHVIFYIKTSGRTRGQFDEHGHSMPQFLLSYPAVPCFSK